MSEKDSNIRNHGLAIFGLALISVSLGVLGLAVFAWRLLFYRLWWSEYVARSIIGLLGIAGLVFGYFALARISKRVGSIVLLVLSSPLLLSVCSYPLVGRSVFYFVFRCSRYLTIVLLVLPLSVLGTPQWKSWLRGKSKTGALAALGIVVGVFLAGSWWVETCGPVSLATRMVCGTNLTRLGRAMRAYATEKDGQYPDPNRWCDLLLRHANLNPDLFLCPKVKWRWGRQVFPFPIPRNKRSYYALNPHCEPNSPDDTVLLFEIAGGWNKAGGPELLSDQNHEGDGCNVVFADGHVRFVRAKQFAELGWGAGQEKLLDAIE